MNDKNRRIYLKILTNENPAAMSPPLRGEREIFIYLRVMIVLDHTITAALGVLALVLGRLINGKMKFLSRICIPDPVTGGLVVSFLSLVLKAFTGVEISFDTSIQDICMLIFFTSIGFQCDLSAIKKGGKQLVVMIVLVAVLIVLQNFVAVGVASTMGLDPVFGMVAGSIPMCGGHGTAAGFSELLESNGIDNARSITMATATFGLVAGSLIGGPIAGMLISRKHLSPGERESERLESERKTVEKELSESEKMNRFSFAAFEIFIAMGLGSLLGKLLSMTGISFPSYFGALVCAIVLRNVTEAVPKGIKMHSEEITKIGSVCLALFLGMAMCSLRLWELAGLALPLCIMLISQVVLMILFCRFIAFPLLGRNYNAAVLVGGVCGFGLGATPNAMANMSAICSKHGYTGIPFIIVPLVGASVVDIMNITAVSLFISFL